MVQVGILFIYQYRLLSVAAILDVLDTANNLHKKSGRELPFNITLLNQESDNQNDEKTFYGYPIQSISSSTAPDLILIPSFTSNDIKQGIVKNQEYLPWLNKQYKAGAEIASFCTGAFLLGASGLLNEKVATTHVDACTTFAAAFPAVTLKADKTVTRDGRICTSGGSTSSFHLLLHLVQKYCGKDIAVRIAKIFAIDMNRESQSYFSTFSPDRNHNDDLVATAQEKIETNYQDSATIEEIIKDIPSSRRNIVRRFKQVTGITPIEYLQLTRVEAAKKLLEETNKQMSEVIFNTGYNDPKAFRKVFRKNVGMTPSEYRDRFQVR
ncbi:MAG: helix-turn-helix domain-containing protein [Chitinophagaceae bacterium]|nr:helix-turn-helix domain-containing protein [Chitinophagaceae bacterium]